jgi:transposase
MGHRQSPLAVRRLTTRRPARCRNHEPHKVPQAYLKDILARLPTNKASDISALLPHRWQPTVTVD